MRLSENTETPMTVCDVWLGYKSQEFSCELCGAATPKVKFSEFKNRNDEADGNSSWDEF